MSRYSSCLCPCRSISMDHTNKTRRRIMSLPFCVLTTGLTCTYCSMRDYIFSVFSLCFRCIIDWGEVRLQGVPETMFVFQAMAARPVLRVAHARSVDTAAALHYGDPGQRGFV